MKFFWFDDNREFVDRVAAHLRTLGHEVRVESTWDAALKACQEDSYDVVLVDWRLSEARTGTEFFALLDERGLQSQASWCLASYHYDGPEAEEDPVPEDSVPAKVRPVPIDSGSISSLETFRDVLLPKVLGSSDPTALPFGAYAALELLARAELVDEVYARYEEKIRAYLDGQYVWILVCGADCDVIATAENPSEIKTDDEIWDLADSVGFAPYQFFADDTVEDCASSGDLGGYPSVTLELIEARAPGRVDIHYDTGTPTTYIDGAFLLREVIRVPGRKTLRGHESSSNVHPSTKSLKGTMHCQITDQSSPIDFKAEVVADWRNSHLARRCVDHRCPAPTSDGLCRYRSGLVGRNLQLETGLRITLVPLIDPPVKVLKTKIGDEPGFGTKIVEAVRKIKRES